MRKPIGVLIVTTIGFSQWEAHDTGLPDDAEIYGFVPLNEDTVWACGGWGAGHTAIRTTDGGSGWSLKTVTGASGLEISSIAAIDGNTAWVLMYDYDGSISGSGTVFKTSDGGNSWTQQATAFSESGGFPNVVYFFDSENGLALGDQNSGYFEFYSTGDGGANWARVQRSSIPEPFSWVESGKISLFSAVGDTLWYPTTKGRVYRTTDKGESWSVYETGLEGTTSCAFRNAYSGLAVSEGSPYLFAETDDAGETWTLVDADIPRVYDMSYVPGTTGTYVIGGGGKNGSAFTLDEGQTWTQIDDAPRWYPKFVSPSVGWAGSSFGEVYRYSGPPLEEGFAVFLDSLEVNETYDVPGSERVLVAHMRTFEESYSLSAEIMAVDTSSMDTLTLADDGLQNDGAAGDDIWGGSWLTDSVERTYKVNLLSPDYHVWDYNAVKVRFTTIGPVVYDGITFLNDSIPNPGDNLLFRIGLSNNGSDAFAMAVTAELTSTNPCVASIGSLGDLSYGDIEHGESSTSSGAFSVEITETCSSGTDVPFEISIASDGYFFWSDSFAIPVSLEIGARDDVLPHVYALRQNYPNPFNPITTLQYDLPEREHVTLTIHDILGRQIKTLVEGMEEPGSKSVIWDGTNDMGQKVGAGIYLFSIKAGDFTRTLKMLLLK